MTDPKKRSPARRANDLDGREWTRHSISIWSDLQRTPQEAALQHPALFPAALAHRLIVSFSRSDARRVLDPFAGSGSTLVAACETGGEAAGFELNPEYRELAERRLREAGYPEEQWRLYGEPAEQIPERLPAESVDLCITSPPYWNILARRRSADQREVRDYTFQPGDLARIDDYAEFLERLAMVFDGVFRVMKPSGYCIINVMDLRKGNRFFPFHADLAGRLCSRGSCSWVLDDLLIWDRRSDYNSLRPLGYPAVFRINKVHEYLLIFQRPPTTSA